jgi:hypothetical protein
MLRKMYGKHWDSLSTSKISVIVDMSSGAMCMHVRCRNSTHAKTLNCEARPINLWSVITVLAAIRYFQARGGEETGKKTQVGKNAFLCRRLPAHAGLGHQVRTNGSSVLWQSDALPSGAYAWRRGWGDNPTGPGIFRIQGERMCITSGWSSSMLWDIQETINSVLSSGVFEFLNVETNQPNLTLTSRLKSWVNHRITK